MKQSEKYGKRLTLVCLSACLMLSLSACGSRQIRIDECEQPELRGDTYSDLAVLAIEQKAALEICSLKIRATQ